MLCHRSTAVSCVVAYATLWLEHTTQNKTAVARNGCHARTRQDKLDTIGTIRDAHEPGTAALSVGSPMHHLGAHNAYTDVVTMSTAVVFTAVNTIATRQVALPSLGARDVLVRNQLTGISPILEGPLMEGEITHLPGMEYPLVPGHEAVGKVIAIGSNVPPDWLGTSVFVGTARAADGVNAAWGTQCAQIVAPLDEVLQLHGLDPRAGIFLTQLAVALHSLNLANVEPGCRVLILGQGPLGQLLARIVRLHGAGHVAVADTSTRRLNLAVADQPILLPPASQSRLSVWSAGLDREVDLLIDTTGDTDLITRWLPALRRHGALLLLSFYARLELAFLQKPRNGIRIVLSSDWTSADLIVAHQLLAEGKIDLTELVSHTFPISHVGQAYIVALGDPDAMKVLLTWE